MGPVIAEFSNGHGDIMFSGVVEAFDSIPNRQQQQAPTPQAGSLGYVARHVGLRRLQAQDARLPNPQTFTNR